jgi:DNA invertase Pin-like site-specific DNA recombinase
MKQYIAYLRVSTKGQERYGLGLEAQRAIIEHYTAIEEAEIIQEFVESDSGKTMENRPKLKETIELFRTYNYTLIVAKLDRLSRDVEHILVSNGSSATTSKVVSCQVPTV